MWEEGQTRQHKQTYAEPSAGQHRGYGPWTAGKKQNVSREAMAEQMTDELKGLVAMANMAARRGCGDFIWFSWNPSRTKGHKRQPGDGSQLIGVTKAGAEIFLREMNEQKPTHFDDFIKANWWTSCPPSEAYCPDECWMEMLRQYSWVAANGIFLKPEIGNIYTNRNEDLANVIRRTPGRMTNMERVVQPISMLACEIVTDHPVGWYNALRSSAREWGTRRKNMTNMQGELQPSSMLACQVVTDFPVGWHNGMRSSAREAATRRKNMLAYKARCFAAGSQACRSWLNLQHPVACAGWGGGDVLDSDSIVCGLLCGMSKGRAPIQPFAALCMSSQV